MRKVKFKFFFLARSINKHVLKFKSNKICSFFNSFFSKEKKNGRKKEESCLFL